MLAKVKRMLPKDPAVQAVMARYSSQLKGAMKAATGDGSVSKEGLMSVEALMNDFFDRKVEDFASTGMHATACMPPPACHRLH